MKETTFFNIYEKLYKPKFGLGDRVKFIIDNDNTEYMVYAYLIDINNKIQYKITSKGNYYTVDSYEIEFY